MNRLTAAGENVFVLFFIFFAGWKGLRLESESELGGEVGGRGEEGKGRRNFGGENWTRVRKTQKATN
jgi:hypothetical protein